MPPFGGFGATRRAPTAIPGYPGWPLAAPLSGAAIQPHPHDASWERPRWIGRRGI